MKCKVKYPIFAVLVAFLVLVISIDAEAVSIRDIDDVRNKGVLDSSDFQVIDKFVSEAVRELVRARDFTSIAKIRTVISSRKSSSRPSDQGQYSERFSESAYKYISRSSEEASALKPQERQFKVVLNLLILVDSLEDTRLARLAMKMLSNENRTIRYWAVHSVTNPGLIKQLNTGNSELAVEIAEQLSSVIEGASAEVLALIVKFAAEVNVQQGQDLLLKIADARIKKYADWTVDYALLDGSILKLLYGKMASGGSDRGGIGRRFGQLYSYAMQKYIMDINGGSFLSDGQRRQLASVLAEIEASCIGKAPLNMPQITIRKAVGQGDYMTLSAEHSRLLGDETRAGELCSRLDFDYGKKPDGSRHTAPVALPERPKGEASDEE